MYFDLAIYQVDEMNNNTSSVWEISRKIKKIWVVKGFELFESEL